MRLTYRNLIVIFFLKAFFFSGISYSQQVTWGFKIGGNGSDYGQSLYKDANGNIYNCGVFSGTNVDFDPSTSTVLHSSNGLEDGYFVKYSPTGQHLLSVTIGGGGLDKVNSIATDASGNIYICGFFRGANVDFDPSPSTAYLSSNGDNGGDPGYGGDIFVAKYSATGQYIWAFNVGGTLLGDNALALKVDGIGSVVVGGYFRTTIDFDPSASVNNLSANTGTAFLAKYSTNGEFVWAFNFGATVDIDNTIFDLKIDAANNIFITGFFQGVNIDFDPSPAVAALSSAGNFESFVAKYDQNGQYQFAFKIGGSGLDTGRGITFDNSGNIYVLGDFNGSSIDFDPSPGGTALLSSNGASDIFIAKYTNTGQYVWAFNAGSSGGEIGWKIATDNVSIFITGGFSGTADFNPGAAVDNLVSIGASDIFLAKYDLDRNYQCAFNIGSPSNDNGFDILIGDADQFYLTGSFQGTNVDFAPSQSTFFLSSSGNNDAYLVKYLWPPNTSPAGSLTGNVICKGATGQLTFTATAGTSPFTIQYTDGVNTYTQSNVYSGVPFNVQFSPLVTTNYTATLIQDAVRCSPPNNVSINATITVDNAEVRTRTDTTVCKSTQVVLSTTGAQTYSWSPSTFLSSTSVANPVATPDIPMQYIVTGTTINGCILKDTVNVGIYAAPVISISNDTAICRNSALQLNISGGQSYSWSPAATLTNPNSSSPTASPLANTVYYVDITDNNTCLSRDSVFISIRPDAVFVINPPTSMCLNDTVQLIASGGDTYSWQPATGLNNAGIASPLAFPTVQTTYTVTVSENICNQSAVLSTVVTPMQLPVVIANKSNDIDCTTGSVILNGSGASTYSWSPASTLSSSQVYNPIASPVVTTSYIVEGTDMNGCKNYDTITVNVTRDNPGGYLMPTGFTPNNDGLNDCFGVKYWGVVEELDFRVYNRWGQLIFQSRNVAACWDGKYKGVLQPSDVFVYVVKAKTSCQGEIFRKGTFTLIK